MLRFSTVSYYQADGLGSTTSLSNAAGALAQTYTFDSFGKQTVSSGSLTNSFQFTGRELDSETNLYFYRARYFDPATGRFLSEDPIGFAGGNNFYTYVLNRPIQFADPLGFSPQDVQRIKAACKRCTQGLTDAGYRLPGSGQGIAFRNDQLSNLNSLNGTHLQGCKSQANMVKPCLEDPKVPYDGGWQFNVEPWWLGSHYIVVGQGSDPNDPVVYCDPWRNYTWTGLKYPAGGKK